MLSEYNESSCRVSIAQVQNRAGKLMSPSLVGIEAAVRSTIGKAATQCPGFGQCADVLGESAPFISRTYATDARAPDNPIVILGKTDPEDAASYPITALSVNSRDQTFPLCSVFSAVRPTDQSNFDSTL